MANYQLPPPDPMVCAGIVAANWKAFKEAFNDFATATELTTKDDAISVETGSGHPGRVIRVTFSPGLTRFTIYPGLTRIGSREKRNCSFDDVETYKRYRVALS